MIGRQIGRYRITEEIGRGGMGIVYKATQVTLNRTVAVKMLPQDLASSGEYLARFTREAETLASLQHPNIVHIYDVEEADGDHFIIMEYVGGPPLTKRLAAQGRLDAREVRVISTALAGALEAAHRKEIIHRDIKPDNILFSEDGTPKLTDFGIARMRDSNVKTQTGVMLGTPYYMSPEQVSGADVVGASDVYSLGVVMYEMLSGRVPFTASTPVAVALKHLQESATPLSQLVPSIPPGMGAIVDRAMAKDVNTRFGSATSIREALNRLDLRAAPAAPPITACPRCGSALQTGFRACPSCALSLDGLGPIGAPEEPESGGSTIEAGAAAVRKVAGGAKDVAEGGLEQLSAASGAVADSAGAAWSAVSRSAEAVWSAVSGDRSEEELESVPDERLATPELTASATGAEAWSGDSVDAPADWRARAAQLPPIMWAGLVLVVLGLLTATALAVGSATNGRGTEIVLIPPTNPPEGSLSRNGSAFGPPEPPRDQVQQPAEVVDEDPVTPAGESDQTAPDSEPETQTEDPSKGTEIVKALAPEPEPEAEAADPLEDEEIAPGFNVASARQQLSGIVERQRRATEENDEALYLLDMDREARSADGRNDRNRAARGLRDLHDDFREVASTITNVQVTFADSLHATVRYHAVLSAVPKGQSERRTLVDSNFSWTLEFKRGRWLIVTF